MASHNNPAVPYFNHELWTKNTLQDATTEAHILYQKLKDAGKVVTGHGGTEIKGDPVRISRLTVNPWNGVNQYVVTEPDIVRIPQHGWAGYQIEWTVKHWDLLANQGPEKINDMVDTYEQATKEDITAKMGSDVYVDGSALAVPTITGLEGAVKASGTYGTLDSTQDYWKSYLATGTTPISSNTFIQNPGLHLTAAQIATTHGTSQGGKNQPQLVLMGPTAYQYFHYWTEQTFRQIVTREDAMKGAGHTVQMWNGMEIAWDRNLSADRLYLLNLNYWKWYFQSSRQWDSFEHKLIQPPGRIWQWFAKMQLVCTQPRFQGRIATLGL